MKQLTLFIDYHIKYDRNNSWSNFLRKFPAGNKKFRKITKAVKGKQTRLHSSTIDDAKVYDSKEKSNIIPEVSKKVHSTTTNLTSSLDHRVMKHIHWLDRQKVQHSNQWNKTSKDEVKYYTKTLKNSKAPDNDGINAIILKNISANFIVLIVKIYNWCLKNTIFQNFLKLRRLFQS